ncbi:hypothetical protein SNEBB_006895 [Seison nebaliae]|nr:hypothetical protein SNEBB_006895 [Seison nebaliae]
MLEKIEVKNSNFDTEESKDNSDSFNIPCECCEQKIEAIKDHGQIGSWYCIKPHEQKTQWRRSIYDGHIISDHDKLTKKVEKNRPTFSLDTSPIDHVPISHLIKRLPEKICDKCGKRKLELSPSITKELQRITAARYEVIGGQMVKITCTTPQEGCIKSDCMLHANSVKICDKVVQANAQGKRDTNPDVGYVEVIGQDNDKYVVAGKGCTSKPEGNRKINSSVFRQKWD